MRDLRAELAELRERGLYRSRRVTEPPQRPRLTVDGRPLLSFCSNDYLGLADHPAVADALRAAVNRHGVGSGASHLVSGHSRPHQLLEEELAEFLQRPRALLFSTGYMANLGVITSLAGRGDLIAQDRLVHASLIDAAQLSRARLLRYRHADASALEEQLLGHPSGERLVVTDGVFSMDGDVAPLVELVTVCRRRDAWLVVDDAHGLGVLGAHGRGSLEHLGLPAEQVPALIVTLGKALGCFGAAVAGSDDLIDYLIQRARSYIYTTALPPALAECSRAALRVLRERPEIRERLHQRIAEFRRGARELNLPLEESPTAIQPLVLGSVERALAASRALEARGLLVTAIRPPTVPQGTARLRITLSAAHQSEDIARLLEALASVLGEQPPVASSPAGG